MGIMTKIGNSAENSLSVVDTTLDTVNDGMTYINKGMKNRLLEQAHEHEIFHKELEQKTQVWEQNKEIRLKTVAMREKFLILAEINSMRKEMNLPPLGLEDLNTKNNATQTKPE